MHPEGDHVQGQVDQRHAPHPLSNWSTRQLAIFAQTGVEETESDANQPAEGSAEESALGLGMRLLRVTPGQPLMHSSDVLAVQTRLLAKGYAPGKLDGIFGNITKAAVVALQTACGIKADGIVGPDTRVFLQ
jgi:peptidoglycan hydrolase-like protein with peptidoglycan-binding domain